VCERLCEIRTAVLRGRQSELAPQPLARRDERDEAGRRGEEAAVPVPRRTALLDPGEVEERSRQAVSLGQLAALDLIPGLEPKRHVLPEPKV
jgi:hypothetical protein